MGHEGAVACLAFSPTGQTLASGGADGTVHVWDPRAGQPVGILRQHAAPVTTLVMHPAGADLLSGSKDSLVLRWPRAASGFPTLPLIFRHDFRGAKINREFLKLATKDSPNRYVQEPEGLRVTPPVVVPRGGPSGVSTTFRLRGDFDVIASYEILQAEIPDIGGPIGVTLYVTTDTPTLDAVMLSRVNRKDGSYYTCSGKMNTPIGQPRVFPPPSKMVLTDIRSGQLRLVRQGPTVRFLVADEGADGFHELNRLDLGGEDVLYVRLAVDPGNKDSPPVIGRLRLHRSPRPGSPSRSEDGRGQKAGKQIAAPQASLCSGIQSIVQRKARENPRLGANVARRRIGGAVRPRRAADHDASWPRGAPPKHRSDDRFRRQRGL